MGEVHVSQRIALSLGLSTGDVIFLRMNAKFFLGKAWRKSFPYRVVWRGHILPTNDVYLPVTVGHIFEPLMGKFSMYVTKGIYMEYDHFLPYLVQHLHPRLPRGGKKELENTKLEEYAQQIVWNLPSRVPKYIETDVTKINKQVVRFASDILYRIGQEGISMSLPVLDSLQQTAYFSLFLGLILNVVVFILLLLSILLIYSLLTINVDSKAFEMGVLRCLGITTPRLVYVLSLQAFLYSLPSWIFALLFSQISFSILAKIFSFYTNIPLSGLLDGRSVLVATVFAILVPLIASIFPIRNVLQQELLDALDHRRSKTKAVEISVERSEQSRHLPLHFIFGGLAVALFGFSIYFLFPYSLLTRRLTIFVNILAFLLIGMLLGLGIQSSSS